MDQLSTPQLKEILEALKRHKTEKIVNKEGNGHSEEEKLLAEPPNGNEKETIVEDGKGVKPFEDILTRLKPIRMRYTSSFTMHALDHIINGTIPEKVFWVFKLFVVIGNYIAGYFVINSLILRFRDS